MTYSCASSSRIESLKGTLKSEEAEVGKVERTEEGKDFPFFIYENVRPYGLTAFAWLKTNYETIRALEAPCSGKGIMHPV